MHALACTHDFPEFLTINLYICCDSHRSCVALEEMQFYPAVAMQHLAIVINRCVLQECVVTKSLKLGSRDFHLINYGPIP